MCQKFLIFLIGPTHKEGPCKESGFSCLLLSQNSNFCNARDLCPTIPIKAMLGMLGGGENICGWLFMMELLSLRYHCIRK